MQMRYLHVEEPLPYLRVLHPIPNIEFMYTPDDWQYETLMGEAIGGLTKLLPV